MFRQVTKRSGELHPFDAAKIQAAIQKAGEATGEFNGDDAAKLAMKTLVTLYTLGETAPSVEQIQDVVEEVLLQSPYKKTAKAYILYREQHQRIRALTQTAGITLVDNYLEQLDWQVKENSNMAYSLQGLNNYISSEVSKVYWLNKIYPDEIRHAHLGGDIHIHDLNLLSVYCVGWDLQDLLTNGFGGVPGKAESAPPNHFRSALGQIGNFFYTLQGEAAGAQALSSFDTLLAPFVRKDSLNYAEVKTAVKGFVFNLNVPTRVGFQTPFTNLTLDLKPHPSLRDQCVIVGGNIQPETYGEFQHEMNLINRALFEVLSEGDAKGRVFTFPIPTVNIDSDFDFDDEALVPLWEATARYGIPYFANFVNSELNPDDARSMCCRLRLDTRELQRRGGGLFGANPLTGSIGVVTLNLPRIGKEASHRAAFFQLLKQRIRLAASSLEIKRKVLERFTEQQLYPYTSHYLRAVKSQHNQYWANHFSTIGIVGMHEACRHLLGSGIDSEAGKALALDTLHFIRNELADIQKSTGNFYNLEATPAEGAAFRLAKLDNYKTADDCVQVYTNSTQLPVQHTDDLFDVIDHQDPLQSLYTGGTVLHIFSGEENTHPASIKSFVKKICSACTMPYFTFTPTFSICQRHGYHAGRHDHCPDCGSACEVYSRVVGYLRPVSQWNDGKAAEFNRRASFDICNTYE
ncbi:MAG: ribonucleoside triphosphate reductase [Deltaproteobacteria bacterium]|nr:ribonucleoside triphosphate reductase [Deltaproteobacteria bacterium]MBN2673830.1 ribonucleoside triphosphate reductase [Deltaproteobacteria bacterium]